MSGVDKLLAQGYQKIKTTPKMKWAKLHPDVDVYKKTTLDKGRLNTEYHFIKKDPYGTEIEDGWAKRSVFDSNSDVHATDFVRYKQCLFPFQTNVVTNTTREIRNYRKKFEAFVLGKRIGKKSMYSFIDKNFNIKSAYVYDSNDKYKNCYDTLESKKFSKINLIFSKLQMILKQLS